MGQINKGAGVGFLGRTSRRGDILLAADIQAIKDALRRGRLAAGDGIELIDTPAGTVIGARRRRISAIALTPAGGIPAIAGAVPGSAGVTFYSFNGATLTLTSEAATAYNTTNSAVAGAAKVQLKDIGGYWFVDVESC